MRYNFLIYISNLSIIKLRQFLKIKTVKIIKKKDSKKALPIKLRKGSVDDIKIIKIKKETNNANNLTTKIQKLLQQQ